MAWLRKDPKSPYWQIRWDDQFGRDRTTSSKTTIKSKARIIANGIEQVVAEARKDLLTPDRARDMAERLYGDILAMSGAGKLHRTTVRSFCEQWFSEKEQEWAERTVETYKLTIERFLKFLGIKADSSIAGILPDDIARFKHLQARKRSKQTANLALKHLSALFSAAVKRDYVRTNPVSKIERFAIHYEPREAFTHDEVCRVLQEIEGTEWYGICLLSAHTSHILGDVVGATWGQFDLKKRVWHMRRSKTGVAVDCELTEDVNNYLLSLPGSDSEDAPVFPIANGKSISALSKEFRRTLIRCGLIKAPVAAGEGRDGRRTRSDRCFYSFRHYFASTLEQKGIGLLTRMNMMGQKTVPVHAGYVHITPGDRRRAADAIPEVAPNSRTSH